MNIIIRQTLGYEFDVSGKVNSVSLPNFTDNDIKEVFNFGKSSFLVKSKDETVILVYFENGRCTVHSNSEVTAKIEDRTLIIL